MPNMDQGIEDRSLPPRLPLPDEKWAGYYVTDAIRKRQSCNVAEYARMPLSASSLSTTYTLGAWIGVRRTDHASTLRLFGKHPRQGSGGPTDLPPLWEWEAGSAPNGVGRAGRSGEDGVVRSLKALCTQAAPRAPRRRPTVAP